MYLSKIVFNIKSRRTVDILGTAQKTHQFIMSAFDDIPSDTPRKDLGVLFRINETDFSIFAIVSSLVKPSWDKAYNENLISSFEVKDASALNDGIKNGKTYILDALLVPCKRTTNEIDGKKKIKRHFLKDAEEREQWFRRQAEANGFEVTSLIEKGQKKIYGIKGYTETWVNTVNFSATIRITDEEKFRNAHKCGIGIEKAYGAGMLLIARHN